MNALSTVAVNDQQSSLRHWYCVRCQPKREHIAAARLREIETVEVFCPRLRIKRRTQRGPVWFVEAMFPGYLFAQFDLMLHHWRVRCAIGVTGILQFADRFATVDDSLIDELRNRLDPCGMTSMDYTIAQGDTVKIAEGAFKGLEAVVTQIMPAKERVRVLLDFLGREIEAELSERAVLPKAVHPMTA